MRAAVLFAGIGGWESAAGMLGMRTLWAAEWDDWKRARYAECWPDVPLYGDVEKLDGRHLVAAHGPLDILIGSPPCTDISAANHAGAGIDGDQSRLYLERRWTEVAGNRGAGTGRAAPAARSERCRWSRRTTSRRRPMPRQMPDCCAVADAFWEHEVRHGYDAALALTAEEFEITPDEVEALVIEDDSLDNGNN